MQLVLKYATIRLDLGLLLYKQQQQQGAVGKHDKGKQAQIRYLVEVLAWQDG